MAHNGSSTPFDQLWDQVEVVVFENSGGFPYMTSKRWPRVIAISLELLAAAQPSMFKVTYDRITIRCVNTAETYQVMAFDRGALLCREAPR